MEEDAGNRDECGCLKFSYNVHPRFKCHDLCANGPSEKAQKLGDIEKDASHDYCDGFKHGVKEGAQVSEKPSGRPSDHLAIPTLDEYWDGFDSGFRFGLKRKYPLAEERPKSKDK